MQEVVPARAQPEMAVGTEVGYTRPGQDWQAVGKRAAPAGKVVAPGELSTSTPDRGTRVQMNLTA
jgi:hypothetical protein